MAPASVLSSQGSEADFAELAKSVFGRGCGKEVLPWAFSVL